MIASHIACIVTRFHLALSPAKVNTLTAIIIFNERSHEIQGNVYISSFKWPTPYPKVKTV